MAGGVDFVREQAWFRELDAEIRRLLDSDLERIVLAIDGSSAAGKSSLAAELGEKYDAHVFHVDDYFLTDEQRTAERLAAVGEFFDKERLLTEVLEPLRRGEDVLLCRRFDCATQGFSEAEPVGRKRVYIIEGVYSLHPDLRPYYDLQLFLYVERSEQIRRLELRCPEKLERYLDEWLPREEAYFEKYGFPTKSSLVPGTECE